MKFKYVKFREIFGPYLNELRRYSKTRFDLSAYLRVQLYSKVITF